MTQKPHESGASAATPSNPSAKPNEPYQPDVNRRAFVAALAAGAAGTAGAMASAGQAFAANGPPSVAATVAPSADASNEAEQISRSGSDYMVDCLKALKIDFVTTMPGSSFRGLHESLINYGGNSKPELLTCLHEEVAVGMAHGYAKVAHRPLAALLHSVVGVQHGAMAIYNAYADRVPVVVITGNAANLMERRPGVEWAHCAQDNAAMVRDFVKWDDQPASLGHFGESMVRGYRLAMTPPQAPVFITADGELQEMIIEAGKEPPPPPRLTIPSAPTGDAQSLTDAAKLLVGAETPVIIVDRLVRSAEGMANLVMLAELLQAPVIDRAGRMNMPNDHYLCQTSQGGQLVRNADVILALEPWDLWGSLNEYKDRIHREGAPITKEGAKIISITAAEYLMKPNIQDFQRYASADIAIGGDGESSLPGLIDAVRRATSGNPTKLDARAAKYKGDWAKGRARLRDAATYAWDASPISTARMCMELYSAVKGMDWALVTQSQFQNSWPDKLWTFNKHYQHIGGSGGAGVGYSAPAALGAALAHKAEGRLPIAIVGDGELMCAPSTFWTAAHHKIPILMLVHNNRAYHQEVMHVQRMANRHGRGIDRINIGTTMDNPNIDYAQLAGSMGVFGIGPVSDPALLGPAIARALEVVKRGEPAVIDVVSQPR